MVRGGAITVLHDCAHPEDTTSSPGRRNRSRARIDVTYRVYSFEAQGGSSSPLNPPASCDADSSISSEQDLLLPEKPQGIIPEFPFGDTNR